MSDQLTSEKTRAGWNFDNSYVRLPEAFYARQNPVPVSNSRIVIFNHELAESLGLNSKTLGGDEGAALFSGNQIPAGAEPIAQAYAGHQFGHFTMLGDGRAIILGEQITPDGKRFDIQLKGSGQTPFSRRGDGRAALGPMLREYIISEAMDALGIPTTRSLAVITTGEPVFRETVLPGAILTRVAASHIRVGTFEYATARGNTEELRALADYTINRHFPELVGDSNPYLSLLQAVIERQASLVAKWQMVGFIHGVMNTDNVAISGETIDFGPCAFMDVYNPGTVFSSIDAHGRYAYANQPAIAQWNLARFAEALLPLLHPEQEKALAHAEEAISAFPAQFEHHWLSGMRAKLGLFTQEADDVTLIASFLTWMQQTQKDFTNTFRMLTQDKLEDEPVFQDKDFQDWHTQWQARLSRQPEPFEASLEHMRAHNPALIPRNHRVEEALEAAVEHNDFSMVHKLLTILASPYTNLAPQDADYSLPPEPGGPPYRTFCGT